MNDQLFASRFTVYSSTRDRDTRISGYSAFNPGLSRTRTNSKLGRKLRRYNNSSEKNSKKSKPTKTLIAKVNNERRNYMPSSKTSLNLFLQRSSVYALNQVGNSVTARRKVFWTSILLVGVVGIAQQVCQFLTVYLKYPVVVNRDSINIGYQEFPAVTVCNLNVVRKEFFSCLEEDPSNDLCLSDAVETDSDFFSSSDNSSEPLCEDLPPFLSNATLKEVLWLRKLLALNPASKIAYGHQAKDLIRSCRLDEYNCTYRNFVLSVSYSTGNCYIFNFITSKNNLYSSGTGPHTGLELELDLEVNKYIEHTDTVGARVQVHSPYLDHDIDEEGVNISPGYKSFIGLSTYTSVRLPPPYKDHCREYALNDSRRLCQQRCINDISLSSCSCTVLDKNTHPHFKTCDWTDARVVCCLYQNVNHLRREVCDCPLPCHETIYHTGLSQAEWPSKAYYEANKPDFVQETEGNSTVLPFEEVRRTRLRLRVFFDTQDQTVYQQSPMYQSSEVLSQIGGQMGLWLGLSVVAVFECIENIISLCKYRIIGRW